MQANEWINENGWGEAKNLIAASGWRNTPFLIKIKRLVESYDFVSEHGGIERCKDWYKSSPFKRDKYMRELKQAIADVESCQ